MARRGNMLTHLSIAIISALALAFSLTSSDAALPLPSSAMSNLRLRGGQEYVMTRSASQQDLSKPDVKRPGPDSKDPKKAKIWQISSTYKAADKLSIQK
jgi:hypothetical protein